MFDMSRKPLLPRGMQMMPAGIGGGMGPRLMQSSLSPIAIRPYPAMTTGDMVKLGITPGQAAGCAIDAAIGGMQMSSSPRNNNSGIKRRLEPGYRHRIELDLDRSKLEIIVALHAYLHTVVVDFEGKFLRALALFFFCSLIRPSSFRVLHFTMKRSLERGEEVPRISRDVTRINRQDCE